MRRYRREPSRIGAMAIGATYVSTIVGAGFASGQEVLRFFTHFGPWSFAGLAVATVFLSLGGTAIMLESWRSRSQVHGEFLDWLGGPWFRRLYDAIIILFLFGTTAVMVAGAGALLRERLGLPSIVGDVIMVIATVATVLAGIRGVVAASQVVAPLLLGSVAATTIAALSGGGLVEGLWRTWSRPGEAAASSWALSALLYVSYNLILAPAVLTPLAARAGSRRDVTLGGAVGGLVLGLAAACVNLSLLVALPDSATFEAPVLYVAGRLGGWSASVLPPVAGLVLWAEIYTTAASLLYGFALRFGGGGRPGVGGREGPSFRRWVLVGGAGALAAARAGFSNMVITLYPLAGYAGLAFLAVVIYRLARPAQGPRPR